ncbi:male sterile (2) 34Fe [Haematobia irritans]|uniref:male sterile (2) 34Fe n=1 Tax=Haematobia irritans TaxID=7368 RepID=UPI003F505584
MKESNNYNLYCLHFHGNSLKSIKDEFKRQVQTGLRRSICILDLDDVQQDMIGSSNPLTKRNSKDNLFILNVIQAIQDLRQEYDSITKKIDAELKFDLYQYWINCDEKLKNSSLLDYESLRDGNSLRIPNTAKTRKSIITKSKRASKISKTQIRKSEDESEEISCVSSVAKEHNRMGQKEVLSKRKYIEDNPFEGKLLIVIVGSNLTEEFYLDLLRHGQPVQEVIHFVPTESHYDIMLNNRNLKTFIEETNTSINAAIYKLRQMDEMKPIGIVTYNLPAISKCSAHKNQREIFDQLSWSIYDNEVLSQQYHDYYYRPFKVIDVSIPEVANPQEYYQMAKSFMMQGNFSKNNFPISGCDMRSIVVYVDSLLSVCCQLNDLKADELASLPLQSRLRLSYTKRISKLSYYSRFASINTIRKFNRLFIDESNDLLKNLLIYTDPDDIITNLCHISSYLEYDLWKQYLKIPKEISANNPPISLSSKEVHLPKYIKLYLTEDSCRQRINNLLSTYDDYKIQYSENGNKIYTFRTTYNTVHESERTIVIPTRLCYRDFTLFQRNEFLENLVRHKDPLEETEEISLSKDDKGKTTAFPESVFQRPNSLKNFNISNEQQSDHQQDRSKRSSRKHSRQSGEQLQVYGNSKSSPERHGLPENHHLLQGYNLSDTKQEIKVKTYKFDFEYGSIHLYEEKWCFQDMNKQLTMTIADSSIFFSECLQFGGIRNDIHLQTKNNIHIRVLNEPQEYAKIIMNYPNGLTIYLHDIDCEQVWQEEQSSDGEKRRIYTAYGAVIVFFKIPDLILIMRYNGEVYKLYQNENMAAEKEEEEEEDDEEEVLTEVTYSESSQFKHPKSNDNAIMDSLDNELKFLQIISAEYNLHYKHLIITTTQGRQVHIKQDGQIYEGSSFTLDEWHDYYANESYCQRSDGVKMIWTKDSLKCYHKDGTVLTTEIHDRVEEMDFNELDSNMHITPSSSHNYMEEESIYVNQISPDHSLTNQSLKPHSDCESPEECDKDESYISYACSSFLMHHHHYAGVLIRFPNSGSSIYSSCHIDIMGIDDINIYNCSSTIDDEGKLTAPNLVKTLSSNVCIGEQLKMSFYEKHCEILYISKQDSDICTDSLTLKLSYMDCLKDVFKHWTNDVTTILSYNRPKVMELFYVERISPLDNKAKGFEFLDQIPDTAIGYSLTAGNYSLEMKPFKTINELMKNLHKYFEVDMKKFPRFRARNEKIESNCGTNQFPFIFLTSIYCEVPSLLQNIKSIDHLLEPFDNVNFKKLRHKLKNFSKDHLQHQVQKEEKRCYSANLWHKRHKEHEIRKFQEIQRMGLYHAMLKHRKYPNYFQFMDSYKGHVRCIDFFDFVKIKCEDGM